MWCLWKKEFLESVGKNWKDTRWLDRAIDRGVVYHDSDRGYILCIEYIDELIKMSTSKVVPVETQTEKVDKSVNFEVENLRKKVDEQKKTIDLIMGDNIRLSNEKVALEERTSSDSDVDYLNWLVECLQEEKKDLENAIVRIFQNHVKWVTWQDFKEKYGLDFYVDWENE